MDFIKSRWSGSNQDAQVTQSQPIETSYNSVTFTNANTNAHNPIIISTQHPSQISIIHEVRNMEMKVPVVTSPTDSFHSVASTIHNDKRKGNANFAFNESRTDMNNQQASRSSLSPQNR